MQPRRVGRAFLVITTLLLLWNLWAFIRNQTGHAFGPDDKLAVRPRSIAAVAKQHSMWVVNTTFATYHAIHLRIPGVHILLPADMADHKFALERLSRVSVDVSPKRLELPREVAQQIFDNETNQLWSLGAGTLTGALLDRTSDHYVVVWRYGDNDIQLLIPEERYQRALAAIAQGHP